MKESWSLFNVPYLTACLQQGCLRGACHRSAQQSRTSSQNSYISHTSCTAPGPSITRPKTRTANNWCWHFHRGVEHLCLQVGSIPIRIWHGRPIYPVPIVLMSRTYTRRQPTKGQPKRHLTATRRPSPCHAFTSSDPGSHLCLMHRTTLFPHEYVQNALLMLWKQGFAFTNGQGWFNPILLSLLFSPLSLFFLFL